MSDVNGLLEEVGKLDDAQKTEFLGEFVAKQNVLWLSNTIKALEEKFDVKAAAGGGVMMAAAPAAGGAAEEEEQTSFDVILKNAGGQKIQVIKVIREVSTLGLKEAKDLADKGGAVKEGLDKEEAEALQKKLKDAGADVELK